MRTILAIAALALSLADTSASAVTRYNARDHSCGDIQSIIEQQGAAIFRYPSLRKKDLTLYDRYVQSDSFCSPYQTTKRVFIPSSDKDSCPVRHCVIDDCDDEGLAGCLLR